MKPYHSVYTVTVYGGSVMTVNYSGRFLVIQDQGGFSVLHIVEGMCHWFMPCVCESKETVNHKVTFVCL